jgi:hypothetical protein
MDSFVKLLGKQFYPKQKEVLIMPTTKKTSTKGEKDTAAKSATKENKSTNDGAKAKKTTKK